ncbi:MAG: YcnI family protein [Actinobacteria bacterium]|nr:YcnI family protein [Actinomycetota bacterium]
MSALFYLLPALLLLATLLLGRYPGERLLLAAAFRRRPPAATAGPAAARLAASRPQLLRGGALLGAALAGRAPPPRLAPRSAVAGAASADGNFEPRSKQMRRITIALTAAACALAAPVAAQAHVSLHPNEVPAEAYAALEIRVPSESDTANTVKVQVQVPAGFVEVSPEALPEWEVKVTKTKLAKPIQGDDGPITEAVREIEWTPSAGAKGIPPGEFESFPISTQIPGKPGETLTFKVLQTYSDGEIARWIGGPESENPAPEIDVTAAGGVLQDVAGGEVEPPRQGTAGGAGNGGETGAGEGAPAGGSSSHSDSASKGLGIAAFVVGALGLIVGGVALVRSRRGSP